jgi:hypothetical protein
LAAKIWANLGASNGGRSIYIRVEDGVIGNHRAGDSTSVASCYNGASGIGQRNCFVACKCCISLQRNVVTAIGGGFAEPHRLLVGHGKRTSHGVAADIHEGAALAAPCAAIPYLQHIYAACRIKPLLSYAVAGSAARCRADIGGSCSNVNGAHFNQRAVVILEKQPWASNVVVHCKLPVHHRCGVGALVSSAGTQVAK